MKSNSFTTNNLPGLDVHLKLFSNNVLSMRRPVTFDSKHNYTRFAPGQERFPDALLSSNFIEALSIELYARFTARTQRSMAGST